MPMDLSAGRDQIGVPFAERVAARSCSVSPLHNSAQALEDDSSSATRHRAFMRVKRFGLMPGAFFLMLISFES